MGRSLRFLAAIFVMFLAARLALLLGGKVFTSFDSWVYAPQRDPARNLGPLVSFTGNAPRPWGLPAFYALFPNDAARAAGQWLVGTVAWAGFAWEISQHLRSWVARYAACAAILTLGAMNTVASWDLAILTESMSISLGLVTVTLLLRWIRLSSFWYLAGAVAVAIWWTFVRPDIRLFTVVIIVSLGVYWLRLIRRGESPWRGMPLQAAVSALLLVLALGWYTAITPAMMQRFARYDGDAMPVNPLPLDEELFVHRLRVITFTTPELLEVFHRDLRMPVCPGTERFATRTDWATVEFAEAYVSCPEMVALGQAAGPRFLGQPRRRQSAGLHEQRAGADLVHPRRPDLCCRAAGRARRRRAGGVPVTPARAAGRVGVPRVGDLARAPCAQAASLQRRRHHGRHRRGQRGGRRDPGHRRVRPLRHPGDDRLPARGHHPGMRGA